MQCEPAATPLRIAFVYSRVPFPMMRGDQLTVAHLLSFLKARGHAIDFFTLKVDGEMTEKQSHWLNDVCRSVKIYPHSLVNAVVGLAKGVLRGLPLQVGYFRNGALERDVAEALKHGDYDVVYVYYIRSAPVVRRMFKAKTAAVIQGKRVVSFLAMQLSQTLNTERIFRNEKSALKRIVYWFEWRLLRRFEARVWQNYTRTVLIGPRDVEAVSAVCASEGLPQIDNWVYGAHGTNTDSFLPAKAEEIVPGRIVFSGSMLYQPNIQAVQWFVQNCWDRVRAAVPEAVLVIQGRDPVAEIRALDGKTNIEVTGSVPDVGPVIRSAAVCINPVMAAGGMQNKLIEYMASAKAVVATSVANEGILAPSDTLVTADEPDAFADRVIDLLKDREAAIAMGARARAYVLSNWTWEAHFLKLEGAMFDALEHDGYTPPDLSATPY
jgi:glycosyltransferase involved in cell wall biosynthesis